MISGVGVREGHGGAHPRDVSVWGVGGAMFLSGTAQYCPVLLHPGFSARGLPSLACGAGEFQTTTTGVHLFVSVDIEVPNDCQ